MPVCHGSPSLAFAQARWRQLRSCAGALESIIWAYRTRVAPFEPDALHPNADDDKAERTLHLELVEWRQGLAAGADLNSTTLRRRFPGSVFKHGQRRPKADSFWQRQMSWLQRQMSWLIMTWTYLICCGKRSWTDAAQAKAHANAQEDKDLKTQAYCAPPDLQPQKSRSPTRNQVLLTNSFHSLFASCFFCSNTTTVAGGAQMYMLRVHYVHVHACACASYTLYYRSMHVHVRLIHYITGAKRPTWHGVRETPPY